MPAADFNGIEQALHFIPGVEVGRCGFWFSWFLFGRRQGRSGRIAAADRIAIETRSGRRSGLPWIGSAAPFTGKIVEDGIIGHGITVDFRLPIVLLK